MLMQTAVPDAALATMCKLYSVDVGTEQGERSRQAIKARADPIVQGGLGKTLLFPIIVHKHLSIFSRTGKTDCLLPVSAESTRASAYLRRYWYWGQRWRPDTTIPTIRTVKDERQGQ